MVALKTAKYFRESPFDKSIRPEEASSYLPTVTSDETFGNMRFHTYTQMLVKPLTMVFGLVGVTWGKPWST